MLTLDYGDVRITGVNHLNNQSVEGRLEFQRHDGSWGTVCDKGFTTRVANVTCRQLGFLHAAKVLYNKL